MATTDDLWAGVSAGLKALAKCVKTFPAALAKGAVPTEEWRKIVIEMVKRSNEVPSALAHASKHQAAALKSVKKLAEGLDKVVKTARAAVHLHKRAADPDSSASTPKKACKALAAAWKQWQPNETKLRMLLKMPPRAPSVQPAAGPSAAAKPPAPQADWILASKTQIVGHAGTARERALRSVRFAAATPASETDDPEGGQLLRSDDGRLLQGTNTALEKGYLRLTPGSLPRVADVRPPRVLAASLQHVKRRWSGGASYDWVNDQLKAIRQDLVVQGVRGRLAAAVYECHARIALEAADAAAHQQCQSMLRLLHQTQGYEGASCMEFAAYRLLHAAMADLSGFTAELRALPGAALSHPYIRHALACQRAYCAKQWYSLLVMYNDAPCMTPYLLDQMFERARRGMLRTMMQAYRPSVCAMQVCAWLGYSIAVEAEKAACEEFLSASGAVLADSSQRRVYHIQKGVVLDCALSLRSSSQAG